MGKWIAGALAALAILYAPTAFAQDEEPVMRSVTGTQLVEILQKQGFAASLTIDPHGDPLILAELRGVHFQILTYGCDGNINPACQQLQMVAIFNLDGGPSETDIAMMNAYNQRFLFGRAYIDPQGAAAVDYTVNIEQGITEDNLVHNMMIWHNVLTQFVNGLGWSVSS